MIRPIPASVPRPIVPAASYFKLGTQDRAAGLFRLANVPTDQLDAYLAGHEIDPR